LATIPVISTITSFKTIKTTMVITTITSVMTIIVITAFTSFTIVRGFVIIMTIAVIHELLDYHGCHSHYNNHEHPRYHNHCGKHYHHNHYKNKAITDVRKIISLSNPTMTDITTITAIRSLNQPQKVPAIVTTNTIIPAKTATTPIATALLHQTIAAVTTSTPPLHK
jgi:hypothetical protein